MTSSLRLVAVSALSIVTFASTVQAQMSPVRIRVEQVAKSDTEKEKKTQKRSLKVHISNSSKQDLSLIVRYAIFKKDVKEKDVSVLDQGDRPGDTKAMSTQIVETPTATSTFTDKTFDKKGKKTEAKGDKISGYGVQVYHEGKIVAEAYEPLALKEQMPKAAPTAVTP